MTSSLNLFEFIFQKLRSLLDPNLNPLRHAPAFVRYLATILLASFWCLAFGVYFGDIQNIGYNMLGHAAVISMVFVINTTSTLTTTWQRFSHTFSFATTATQFMPYFQTTPVGTASTNDWLELTGVQIDVGSVALPFRRSANTLQGELAACQRYYWRTTATANSYQLFTGFGSALSVNSAIVTLPVPTKMRTSPSSVDFSTLALSPDNGAVLAVTNAAMQLGVGDAINVSITATGLLTQYRPYQLLANNSTSAYIGVSAEL